MSRFRDKKGCLNLRAKRTVPFRRKKWRSKKCSNLEAEKYASIHGLKEIAQREVCPNLEGERDVSIWMSQFRGRKWLKGKSANKRQIINPIRRQNWMCIFRDKEMYPFGDKKRYPNSEAERNMPITAMAKRKRIGCAYLEIEMYQFGDKKRYPSLKSYNV